MTMDALRVALPADALDGLLREGALMTDESVVRVALGADRRVAERA